MKLKERQGDLISREQAILKCQELLYESASNNVGIECEADEVFSDIAHNRIRDWLEAVPSAERNGEWLKYGDDFCCSECGSWAYMDECDEGIRAIKSDFCPSCGARMVNEDDH